MNGICDVGAFETCIYALYFVSFVLNIIAVYYAWQFRKWYAEEVGRALKIICYSFTLLLVIYVTIGLSIIYSQVEYGVVLMPQIDNSCVPWLLIPWILMSLVASALLWKASTIMRDMAERIIEKEKQDRKRKARKSKPK